MFNLKLLSTKKSQIIKGKLLVEPIPIILLSLWKSAYLAIYIDTNFIEYVHEYFSSFIEI